MLTGISLKEFKSTFKTNEDCMQYLVDLKWQDGYKCSKCGHDQCCKGRQWFYKRCKKCGYNESATSNTLFHRCKLNLLTVFELIYRISVRKKGMSSCELAKEFGCQQKTAWLLKAKLQLAMKSSEQFDLQGNVEVDEFLIGGFEAETPGRSHGKKALVVLAIERVVNKDGKETIGRAYAKKIDDGSAKCLQNIFDTHIAKDADVVTDGWRGYLPLQKDWEITQKLSKKGENFKLLHTHIMNIKGWLRGIHHQCSKERLQDYLNEYHFRFNRRGYLKSICEKLIQRAMLLKPIPYAMPT
jgi:transposase-like protein